MSRLPENTDYRDITVELSRKKATLTLQCSTETPRLVTAETVALFVGLSN